MRIAMVCLGNICRSPMAEHVLRAKAAAAGLDIEVASAGTGGWHVGDPADHRAVAVLSAHGYSSEHRAQQFDEEWFNLFDLVAVMDKENLHEVHQLTEDLQARSKVRLLRSFDPKAPRDAVIPDPYYGNAETYETCLRLIEDACDGLVEWLRVQRPA